MRREVWGPCIEVAHTALQELHVYLWDAEVHTHYDGSSIWKLVPWISSIGVIYLTVIWFVVLAHQQITNSKIIWYGLMDLLLITNSKVREIQILILCAIRLWVHIKSEWIVHWDNAWSTVSRQNKVQYKVVECGANKVQYRVIFHRLFKFPFSYLSINFL